MLICGIRGQNKKLNYLSIIRIFRHCGIDCHAPDAARAKRILAAEFSIAPGGVISIDGFDYTANDVFEELERDDFARRLQLNMLIWKTPILLNCLEKHEADLRQIQQWETVCRDWLHRQITGFIAPYFAVSFDKIMGKLLNEARFADADAWLKTRYFLDNSEDRRASLSSTRLFITDFIKLLKNLNDVTYKNHLPQLENWFSQPWSRFVNHLPTSLYHVRNDLLRAMFSFMLVIRNTDSDLCRKMSRQMREVRNINANLQKEIAGFN